MIITKYMEYILYIIYYILVIHYILYIIYIGNSLFFLLLLSYHRVRVGYTTIYTIQSLI